MPRKRGSWCSNPIAAKNAKRHSLIKTPQSGRPPGSRWTLEDVRINRTQVAESTTGPARASLRTRPDLQLTIRDPEGGAQRFLIEYDRSPPTRALSHARGILERDPTAIVILKVIGFEGF